MKIEVELGNELFAGQPMGPRIDALLRGMAEASDLGFDFDCARRSALPQPAHADGPALAADHMRLKPLTGAAGSMPGPRPSAIQPNSRSSSWL